MHSTTGSYDSGMVEETCHTFDMIFCSKFMKDSWSYSWKVLVTGQWMKLRWKRQNLPSFFRLERGGSGLDSILIIGFCYLFIHLFFFNLTLMMQL